LFLWAEDQDLSNGSGNGSRLSSGETAGAAKTANGRQRTPKVPSHPSQAAIGQLRSALAAGFTSIAPSAAQPATAVVWLPSQDGLPLTRRNVFRSAASGNGGHARTAAPAPTLMPWQVTGLALSPLAALACLSHLTRQPLRSRETETVSFQRVRLGHDLTFWSNAAKFTLEILVGQHFLPGLRIQRAGQLEGRWQPLWLDPRTEQRRSLLVAAMPPVCRAYNLDDPSVAPLAAELLDHFVSTLVDTAIRAWTDDALLAGAPQTPSMAWIRSLLGDDRRVTLPPQPAHDLFQEWHQWTEQLYVVRDANFRICFVLTEPRRPDLAGAAEASTEESAWHLRYYLQARDNPALMVSAHEVWGATRGFVQAGGRQIDQPQERLLAGLGVASRLFPPLERSLHSPQPELSLLSTEEAYQFLREAGPLLESSGFGVILPHWWHAEPRMRLGLRLLLSAEDEAVNGALSDSEFAGDEFADEPDADTLELPFGRRSAGQRGSTGRIAYAWELTLGGQQLTRAQFEQVTAMRTPLLRLDQRWVELDPEQVEAAKRFLAGPKPAGRISLLQAVKLAQRYQAPAAVDQGPALHGDDLAGLPDEILPSLATVESLGLEDVTLTGWVQDALERLRTYTPLDAATEPPGFVGELRPYQRRGVGWLAYLRRLGLGACLADDMGLGKTIQAIALLLHMRAESRAAGEKPDPALLICPTSVVANWRREIERFAPELTALVHHGNTRLSGDDFAQAVQSADLVITSYGTARRDVELLTQFEWGDLILDEAQNIKTPTAKQTLAVRRLRGRNRIALTGTPVENRLAELWSIMHFLNPGYLGAQETFRRQYIVPIERYNDEERTHELRRVAQPFLLRRLKSDPTIISDLPEKNEMVVYCSLSPEQAALYEKTVNEALAQINRSDGIQRRGMVLALLTKLKQIANHPAHFLKQAGPLAGRSGKLSRLTEMMDEALSVGDRALIFTQFVEMGHLLKRHLVDTLGLEALFLHGGTPATQRDKMVQAFQSEDGPPVFVLSLRAGGSGLNLTAANHVFHYDRWWNPAVENQATDRAFRIGQRRNVQVHKFVAAGTLEESIHELIESKQMLAESIVGSGEEWLTELDTDQLRNLLTLRYDAVEDAEEE